MSRSLLLFGLVAVLITCSLAKPFKNGYTKTKESRIKKVEFNGKILEIPVEDVDPFHRETPADEGHTPGAIETDIMLTKEQKAAISNADSTRSKRKAIKATTRHWPKAGGFVIVPYDFNATYTPDVTAVEAAMAHWQGQTCIKFTATSNPSQNRLSFFKGQGCYSFIGMIPGGQQVSIGDGCSQLGTVSHEIGHALGFYHEQSRLDRDDFVTVNVDNIKTQFVNNFDQALESEVMTGLDVAYDYSSAMHYDAYSFGIDSNVPTLIPHDPFAMSAMGQREGLSFLDVKLANLMYKCDEACTSANPCQNDGFRTKDCTCRCSSGWAGNECETADNSANTGPVTEFTLTAASGEVASPNYDGTSNYPISNSIMTYIKGEPGKQIRLKFDFFDVEPKDGAGKCWDYLDIKAGNVYYDGTQYCGNTLPPEIVAKEIMLSFQSDSTVVKRGYHGTFTRETSPETVSSSTTKASTTMATCPGTQSCTSTIDLPVGCSATITSPNFPNNYNLNQQCDYTINAPAGTTILLTIDSIDTESGYDYVEVRTSIGTLIARFFGNSVPGPISTTDKMSVRFKSDGSVTGAGFSATLKALA